VSAPVQYLGPPAYTERKCANTTDTVLVPWAGHLHSYNNKIYFFKYTEAILSNSSTALGNCYGLKLPKCWLEYKKNKIIVLYIVNFRHTFVPY